MLGVSMGKEHKAVRDGSPTTKIGTAVLLKLDLRPSRIEARWLENLWNHRGGITASALA